MGDFFQSLGQHLWDGIRIGGRDISSGIKEAISFEPKFYINLFGIQIPVTDAMISIVVTILILVILGFIFGRRPQIKPTKRQALMESIFEFVINLCKQNGMSQEQACTLLPWTLTLGLYIVVSNLVAILHVKPASKNPMFPISLAIFTLIFVLVMGIRFAGVKRFLYSLVDPMPAMLPFNLLDYIIKPVSLAFRLFGNIFGAYVLLEFISLIIPLILPNLFGLWFDIGDGIVQGVIFMFLSINYIGEIIEKGHAAEKRSAQKRALKAAKKSHANL